MIKNEENMSQRMIPAFLLAAVLGLMAACGNTPTTGEVGRMQAKRDSLKTLYDQLGKELKQVEDWLALNDSATQRSLPLVNAQTLRLGPFTHYIDVHGVVRPDQSAELYSAGGRVASIRVKAGERVRKGQVLISMDNDLVQKQMAQAQAAADLARTTFEKQERLWEQGIGSEMQYLQAKTNKEQAEAALGILHEQQRLTNITAPFDGVVDEVMARAGEMTAPSLPLARVVGHGRVQVEAEVSEVYVTRVRQGAPVKVTFPTIGQSFTAPLLHVSDYINPTNRSFTVSLRAPESEDYVRPNLLGNLQIQDAHTDSALVLPGPAVLQDVQGNSFIYVLAPPATGANVKPNEATARKVFVERMSEYKGMVHVQPIQAGTLKEGDRVVIDGAKNVSDGQAVLVDGRTSTEG